MKISPPPPNQGKPKGGWYAKMARIPHTTRKKWLYGPKAYNLPVEEKRLQSPVRTWADMTTQERETILTRLR